MPSTTSERPLVRQPKRPVVRQIASPAFRKIAGPVVRQIASPAARQIVSPAVRKTAGFLFGSRLAWIYLAVVVASVAFTVISIATDTSGDPNFAAVWPFFATMPWSLIFAGFVPETSNIVSSPTALIGVVVVSTLANLATIGAFVHVIRSPQSPSSASQTTPHA